MDEPKKKIEELENEIINLRKELDLKEINDKNMVSKSELDKVEKNKYLLQSELSIEKEKNMKLLEEINKLKQSLQASILGKDNK